LTRERNVTVFRFDAAVAASAGRVVVAGGESPAGVQRAVVVVRPELS
jgi:hypothetical protein